MFSVPSSLFNTGPFKYCASLSIYVLDFYFSSFSFLTNFDLDLLLPFLLADTPLSLLCKSRIHACQVLTHHTELSFIAGCSSCSFLPHLPFLSLKSGTLFFHPLPLPSPVKQPGSGCLQLPAQCHCLAVSQQTTPHQFFNSAFPHTF